MKKVVLLTGLVMVILVSSNATLWRVNNLPGINANFTSLQAAHNSTSVLVGDTLYLESSSASYGNLVSTKRLVIIGPGFFCGENPETQANISGSVVGTITFNSGSDGSIVAGCTIMPSSDADAITINASNLTIEKNKIVAPSGRKGIAFSGSQNNVVIRQNYILGGGYVVNKHPHAIYCISSANNVTISNNFIKYVSNSCIETGENFSGEFLNNIIIGPSEIFNSVFNNNIMLTGTFTKTNVIYLNNIGDSNQFGVENGNQENVNMNDVFFGIGSTDGQWQLKTGSPAIGAGVGGIDCGMFGGDFPYVLSGIPAIPAIYQLDLNVDNVNQQIEVEMSVKSHN